MSLRRPPRPRFAARGFLLVIMAFTLAVLALIGVGATRSRILVEKDRAGAAQGNTLNIVADAVNKYRTTHARELTAATPVIPGFANPMAPTIAELQGVGYLSSVVSPTLGTAGAYRITINRLPAGCVGPSNNCTTWSLITLANPIVDPERETPDIAYLSAMLSRVATPAGYSAPPDPTVIVGAGNGWQIPNPDPQRRQGIVAVVGGLGANTTPYLTVEDPRDPVFLGPQVTANAFGTLPKTLGSPCTRQGDFASGSGAIMFCNAGQWIAYNGPLASAGAACTTEGLVAYTADGVPLSCTNGVYRDAATAGVRSAGYYGSGAVVAQPRCGAGLTPSAVVATVAATVVSVNNTGSFSASIDPSTWRVSIVDTNGTSAAGGLALVVTMCVPA